MRELLKRVGGIFIEKKRIILPVDPRILEVKFQRSVRFPELETLVGFLRKSVQSEISLKGEYEANFSEPLHTDNQYSDIKKRTTNIIGIVSNPAMGFHVDQNESSQYVEYTGIRFQELDLIPLTPKHFETIDRCKAYLNYYFTKN